jgi:hypothetical protein
MSSQGLIRRVLLRAVRPRTSQTIRNARVSVGVNFEQLEDRTLLAIAVPTYQLMGGGSGGFTPDGSGSPPSGAFTPAGLDKAYGINLITEGGIQQEGAGQTIAIIDAYDNPDFVSSSSSSFDSSDLHKFDEEFNLPEPTGFFTKVNQSGGTTYPAGNTGWGTEIALDVEYVHALAPMANILLVEATSASTQDLLTDAVKWAADTSPATVITMSFSVPGGFSGESAYDSDFTSPSGKGVTFFASTGDRGKPGGYPAESDNVVGVGGTSLYVNSSGNYSSESVWSDGGGGISTYESAPPYQNGLVIHNGSTVVSASGKRAIPDVSLDADPSTGVAVLDSYAEGSSAPWIEVGGTSVSSPCSAALMAITDEIRADNGLGSLDGATQTLPDLYNLYATPWEYEVDFHDITTGSNGYSAGVGYDLGSGIGTPIANLEVPALAAAIPVGMMAAIDGSGDLVISDSLGNTDYVIVTVSGSNYVITDTTQAFIPADVPSGTTLTNNNQTLTVPLSLSGFKAGLDFSLGGGSNTLVVNDAGGNFANAISYNGGTGTSAGLVVEGSGSQTATNTPSGITTGSGTITSTAGNISYQNLTAIDETGLSSAVLTFPNANDTVGVAAGFDYLSGGEHPALNVTGTSGGVGFVPVAFFNDTSLSIKTTAVPGTDAVSIASANNANGITNLSITEPTTTGGTISVNGSVAVAGSLSLSAATVTSSSALSISTGTGLTIADAGNSSTLASVITGNGGLTLVGPGSLDLTGTDTYTGATTASSELFVDGSLTSSVAVGSSATLSGAGGKVAAAVSVTGKLTAGDRSAPTGQLTVGNLTFNSGGVVAVTLDGTTAGSGYDQLITTSTGTINLTNATLNVTLGSGFTPTSGTTFDILVNNGGSPITGTFAGLAQGAYFEIGSQLFTITYLGGTSGHDVVLTALTYQAPTFTSTTTTTFPTGVSNQFTVTATGVPAPTLSESSGDQLPSGISFNASTGVLSGTPAAGTNGTYTLHFTASNGFGTPTTQTFTLIIDSTTTTTLTDNGPNPSTTAQAVSFTASISPTVPNGDMVTLEDASNNNAVLGTSLTSGGAATVVVAAGALSAGTHNIFAVYGGDPYFTTSQSAAISQVVNASSLFQFASATYNAVADPTSLNLTIDRVTGTGSQSVAFYTTDGTATAGTDYSSTGTAANPIVVNFTGNQTTATISIPILLVAAYSGTRSFTVTLENPSSGTALGNPTTATVNITNPPLMVTGATLNANDTVAITFNRAPNQADVHLYSSPGAAAIAGSADVTLVGATTGNINGSLVFDPTSNLATFVPTAGMLSPDTYQLTVVSSTGQPADATAFQSLNGQALANSGTNGDFTESFTVSSNTLPVVSVPNFARGAGQSVNLPTTANLIAIAAASETGTTATITTSTTNTLTVGATVVIQGVSVSGYNGEYTITSVPSNTSFTYTTASGLGSGSGGTVATGSLPINIQSASTVGSASFTLTYDPALLSIPATGGVTASAAALAAGLTNVSYTITSLDAAHSVLAVSLTGSGATLNASSAVALVNIAATVPTNAPYTAKALLVVSNVLVNGAAGVGVSSVDEAAYFGDVTGAQSLSGADASLVSQVAVGMANGFSAYKDLDPLIIGGASGSTRLTGLDATLIAEKAVGLPITQIPNIPTGSTPPTGADPHLDLDPASVNPGQTVAVTEELFNTDASTESITNVDSVIFFDPSKFSVATLQTGSLLTGYSLTSNVNNTLGVIRVTEFTASPLALKSTGGGVTLILQFTAKSTDDPGLSVVKLARSYSDQNGTESTAVGGAAGGNLTLNPAPVGSDPGLSQNQSQFVTNVDNTITILGPSGKSQPLSGTTSSVGMTMSALSAPASTEATPATPASNSTYNGLLESTPPRQDLELLLIDPTPTCVPQNPTTTDSTPQEPISLSLPRAEEESGSDSTMSKNC